MSRMLNKKSAAFVTVLLLVAAGGAYAYFTQTGSGSGTATTGSGSAITVNQTSSITGLTPGSAPQALSGTFDNPNPGSVRVASVTATLAAGAVTDGAGAAITGCDNTDYVIAGATTTVNQTLTPGNGVGTWSGPTLAMVNKTGSNQDACKGAIVHVTYTSV